MRRILSILLTVLFIIGILGAGSLVIKEIQTANGCPKVLGIPACAIILVCFIIPLITHLLGKYNRWYFFFTGLATLIATMASILQFIGNSECPKTGNGTPMCYYSLLLFTGLIVLKIYQLRVNSSEN